MASVRHSNTPSSSSSSLSAYPYHHLQHHHHQNMAVPSIHYPSGYPEELSYPHSQGYDQFSYPTGQEHDMFAPHLTSSWSADPRKAQHLSQQHHHGLPTVSSQHPAPLSIQTQFSDMKSMPYYSAQPQISSSPTSVTSSVSGHSDGIYRHPAPSDNVPQTYQLTSQSYEQQQQQQEVYVKQEDGQYSFPLLEPYHHEHIPGYVAPGSSPSQNNYVPSHGYYDQHSPSQSELTLSDSPSVPSPSMSVTYTQPQQLSCDPRYVTQGSAENYGTESNTTMNSSQVQFPMTVDEIDADADGEDDMDVLPSSTIARTSTQSPASGPTDTTSEMEDDDDDYDSKDSDYVDRSQRRRASISHSRLDEQHNLRPRSSVVRYSPYTSSAPNHLSLDFVPTRTRRTASDASDASSSSSSSYFPPTPTSPLDPHDAMKYKPNSILPLPVPIPNLTKKSRGRRVPTVHNLERGKGPASADHGLDNGEFGHKGNPVSSIPNTAGLTGGRRGAAKGVRMFTCKVDGCGKCFARGEHLKRHVRSIHTYEKPHKCPHPGCGKDFSRHDNLNQHMRVHRKDSKAR